MTKKERKNFIFYFFFWTLKNGLGAERKWFGGENRICGRKFSLQLVFSTVMNKIRIFLRK